MKKAFVFFTLIVSLGFVTAMTTLAQGSYKKPPQEVMDVLNAPVIPQSSVSPARDKILLLTPLRNPPIADLAQPMLRLAGLRINPLNNGLHRQAYSVKLSIKNIADGKETQVVLPAGAKVFSPQWSADGKYVAVGNITPNAIELWVVETASGRAQQIKNIRLNTAFGQFGWMPNQRDLLVTMVPRVRSAPPTYENVVPSEPAIQETTGRRGAVQTFEDLLKNPNDEKLFEFYSTSQLAIVSLDGKVREIGKPGIFDSVDVSPDGKYILTSQVHKPFSYLYPSGRFPHLTEVWDLNGNRSIKLGTCRYRTNFRSAVFQLAHVRSAGYLPRTPPLFGRKPLTAATLAKKSAHGTSSLLSPPHSQRSRMT